MTAHPHIENQLLTHITTCISKRQPVQSMENLARQLSIPPRAVRAALDNLLDNGTVTRETQHPMHRFVIAQVGASPWQRRLEARHTDKTKRNCLRCRKPFQSEGIHNRLCPDCQ